MLHSKWRNSAATACALVLVACDSGVSGAPAIQTEYAKAIVEWDAKVKSVDWSKRDAAGELRQDALCALMEPEGNEMHEWVGTVKDLFGQTGDSAELDIDIGDGAVLVDNNIESDMAVFSKLSDLKEGDKIKFSGQFIKGVWGRSSCFSASYPGFSYGATEVDLSQIEKL